MTTAKMPARLPGDGPVSVTEDSAYIVFSVDGVDMRVSKFNAWRLVGMLAFILGIPLHKSVQKAIKF